MSLLRCAVCSEQHGLRHPLFVLPGLTLCSHCTDYFEQRFIEVKRTHDSAAENDHRAKMLQRFVPPADGLTRRQLLSMVMRYSPLGNLLSMSPGAEHFLLAIMGATLPALCAVVCPPGDNVHHRDLIDQTSDVTETELITYGTAPQLHYSAATGRIWFTSSDDDVEGDEGDDHDLIRVRNLVSDPRAVENAEQSGVRFLALDMVIEDMIDYDNSGDEIRVEREKHAIILLVDMPFRDVFLLEPHGRPINPNGNMEMEKLVQNLQGALELVFPWLHTSPDPLTRLLPKNTGRLFYPASLIGSMGGPQSWNRDPDEKPINLRYSDYAAKHNGYCVSAALMWLQALIENARTNVPLREDFAFITASLKRHVAQWTRPSDGDSYLANYHAYLVHRILAALGAPKYLLESSPGDFVGNYIMWAAAEHGLDSAARNFRRIMSEAYNKCVLAGITMDGLELPSPRHGDSTNNGSFSVRAAARE